MDLFPDWGEIGLNVKIWMGVLQIVCIAMAYLVCFKIGKKSSGGTRKLIFALIVISCGLAFFVSMFLVDWDSILRTVFAPVAQ